MRKLKIGQKVICIEDKFVNAKIDPFKIEDLNLPIKDEIYTIRDIVKTPYGVGIRLDEIKNKKYFFDMLNCIEEPIFGITRFDDISHP